MAASNSGYRRGAAPSRRASMRVSIFCLLAPILPERSACWTVYKVLLGPEWLTSYGRLRLDLMCSGATTSLAEIRTGRGLRPDGGAWQWRCAGIAVALPVAPARRRPAKGRGRGVWRSARRKYPWRRGRLGRPRRPAGRDAPPRLGRGRRNTPTRPGCPPTARSGGGLPDEVGSRGGAGEPGASGGGTWRTALLHPVTILWDGKS